MTLDRARSIEARVTECAREHFEELRARIDEHLQREEMFLTTELTDRIRVEFAQWIGDYPRIGRPSFESDSGIVNDIAARRQHHDKRPFILFVRYYANLFFGVRQAAEIDSLRFAIEQLPPGSDRDWALGALVCAVSACADNYGGHFAQPRIDAENLDDIATKMRDTLLRRTQSVMHEFSARLLSLAKESEVTAFAVETIPGPWPKALQEVRGHISGDNVLVYIDPPYTRDEYSRYYHVLESLVLYNYPPVSGKASVPTKASGSRFASEFFTRDVQATRQVIADMLRTTLSNGWSCLWSYSSGAATDVGSVIAAISDHLSDTEIYTLQHTYKPQGRQRPKRVTEYLLLLRPK